jgi:5'-3' exonuclease
MGIPSYYKKLSDRVKGLVCKSYEGKASALYFDFNCMIYHVARRQNSTLPPYPGEEGKEEWERLLLEDIVKYIVKVWQEVGQPQEVFLAVDGVVPMAKIKQQRLRRFKSVWLAEEEKKEGIRDNVPSWDTNCITPGTNFMKRLTRRLQELCKKHAHWSVSGAEEPGEGEHKIMRKLRAKKESSDPVLIYGLDADLILLTLLNSKSPAYLVREDSAMGVVQLNQFGEEDFSYFSVDVLKKTLPPEMGILDYVTGMSLLGNDFLPHSLSVKIRDDGHDRLLRSLQTHRLVEIKDGFATVNRDGLWSLLKEWAQEEEKRVLHTFKKKLQMRGRVEMNLENRPMEWMVEAGLLEKTDEWRIHPAWKDTYRSVWLQCQDKRDTNNLCREYIFGLQWVLNYYTGQQEVNFQWCFPRLISPLWCDLVEYIEKGVEEGTIVKESAMIQPHEQLAMVLPLESWHLIGEPSLRSLPALLPQFWPASFGFFSAGRTRMWECEPLIPALPVDRLRAAAKQTVD